MNKKTAKLFTFALILGGGTAIYLYFSNKNKKEQPPLPPKKKVGKVYLGGVVNTNDTDLNVRENPNTSSKIVAKLKKDSTVTFSVIENNDNWYLLVDNITNNKIGYVSSQYIKMV
jgi:uncharacterized protein YgiM (DUF1202 family)